MKYQRIEKEIQKLKVAEVQMVAIANDYVSNLRNVETMFNELKNELEDTKKSVSTYDPNGVVLDYTIFAQVINSLYVAASLDIITRELPDRLVEIGKNAQSNIPQPEPKKVQASEKHGLEEPGSRKQGCLYGENFSIEQSTPREFEKENAEQPTPRKFDNEDIEQVVANLIGILGNSLGIKIVNSNEIKKNKNI